MKKNIYLIVLASVIILLISYVGKKSPMVLGTFTERPTYLMDSGCTFYWDQSDLENKKFAFILTVGKNIDSPDASIMINNNLENLNNTEDWKYYNEKFDVEISLLESAPVGSETILQEGKLSIQDKFGKKVIKDIIGYCGS